jgi:plastocyanin
MDEHMNTQMTRPGAVALGAGLLLPFLWGAYGATAGAYGAGSAGAFGPTPEATRPAAGTVQGSVSFETLPDDEFFELSDVVIYLSGEGLAAATQTPAAVRTEEDLLLNQEDYTFVPRVLPVLAGDELTFHNSDDELHNIHTYAKGRRRNRNFNRGQRPGSTFTGVFARPDSVLVLCDIHSQMIAHILVLDNGFFTKVNDDGTYSIGDVPPGEYELTAWSEWSGEVKTTIEVGDGATVSSDVYFPDL